MAVSWNSADPSDNRVIYGTAPDALDQTFNVPASHIWSQGSPLGIFRSRPLQAGPGGVGLRSGEELPDHGAVIEVVQLGTQDLCGLVSLARDEQNVPFLDDLEGSGDRRAPVGHDLVGPIPIAHAGGDLLEGQPVEGQAVGVEDARREDDAARWIGWQVREAALQQLGGIGPRPPRA